MPGLATTDAQKNAYRTRMEAVEDLTTCSTHWKSANKNVSGQGVRLLHYLTMFLKIFGAFCSLRDMKSRTALVVKQCFLY
ncbi:hypothetical protein Y032_0068g223 [Ancylostoma ceylanicum]|uniref:Uncharacterized protein n=1 Tax=Ancylostoma ceylanicum TaxID=53326 RepID=A0A016TY43_9BILA|nr:hypothetical protein Y032_0068g223 [Ancylostoma ceylanicum]